MLWAGDWWVNFMPPQNSSIQPVSVGFCGTERVDGVRRTAVTGCCRRRFPSYAQKPLTWPGQHCDIISVAERSARKCSQNDNNDDDDGQHTKAKPTFRALCFCVCVCVSTAVRMAKKDTARCALCASLCWDAEKHNSVTSKRRQGKSDSILDAKRRHQKHPPARLFLGEGRAGQRRRRKKKLKQKYSTQRICAFTCPPV